MTTIIKSIREIGILTIALTAALVINYAYGAWNDPTSAPTGGNVAIPINESSAAQAKKGRLTIENADGSEYVMLRRNGNILSTGDITTSGRLSGDDFVILGSSPGLYLNDTDAGANDWLQQVVASGNLQFRKDTDSDGNFWDAGGSVKAFEIGTDHVRAASYCDIRGNNCFTASEVGASTCPYGYVWNGFNCVCSCSGGSPVGSCSATCRGSCFTSETQVLMADGGTLPIHEIKLGEKVRGQNGATHTVLGLDRPLLWEGKNQHLIEINGETAFTTDNHPIMTTEGWKALNPAMAELEAYDQLAGEVGQLEIGDEIITENGTILVESIEVLPQEADDRRLYNLLLDGDHTYYANGMLVHGSVPDKDGLYPLAKDHDGEPVE